MSLQTIAARFTDKPIKLDVARSAEFVQAIIANLQDRGFHLVTISKLLQ